MPETEGTTGDFSGTDQATLEGTVQAAIERMEGIMMTSINYNTETTAITTLLGQNANRAAKQTPQG